MANKEAYILHSDTGLPFGFTFLVWNKDAYV